MSTLKTKLVNVECRRPIRLRNKFVRGIYRELLTVEEIADCISQQATVREILPTGDTVVLDFTNYNTEILPSISEEEAAKAEAEAAKAKAAEEKAKAAEAKKKEKEVTPEVKEETPVAAPVKEEEIVENAEEKVSEAKKATKEKK
jgi:hypothetical protein|nr:MAG TPA: hypothetical protein [Caudoviricetes sp.]